MRSLPETSPASRRGLLPEPKPRKIDWYCLRCAHPATYSGLDVTGFGYIGACRYLTAKGKPAGCGDVPITSNLERAQRSAYQVRQREANQAHLRHIRRGERPLRCPECRALDSNQGGLIHD